MYPKTWFLNSETYSLPFEIVVQMPILSLFILDDVVGAVAFFSPWPDILRMVCFGFGY